MGKEKEKGSMSVNIHTQCVWGQIHNTYKRIASAVSVVIIRLTNFKTCVNFCGCAHGFIYILCWNNILLGIRLLRGSIMLFFAPFDIGWINKLFILIVLVLQHF